MDGEPGADLGNRDRAGMPQHPPEDGDPPSEARIVSGLGSVLGYLLWRGAFVLGWGSAALVSWWSGSTVFAAVAGLVGLYYLALLGIEARRTGTARRHGAGT